MKTISRTHGLRRRLSHLLVFSLTLALCWSAPAQDPEPAPPEKPKAGNPPNAGPKAETLEDLLKEAPIDPLSIPKTAITTADYNRKRFEWLQRTLVPAMKREFEGTLDTPAKMAVVDKLLGWWVDTDVSMVENAATAAAFAREVEELASPNAKMPVFQAIAGIYAVGLGRKAEAGDRWRTCVASLDPNAAPGLAGLIAIGGLVAHGLEKLSDPEISRNYFRYLQAALGPEQCSEADAQFLVSFLTTYYFDAVIKPRAEQVLITFSESKLPAWARQTLVGLCEVQIAWNRRGGAVASRVTEQGWRGFEEHLVKARTALAEGWKLRPDRPEAATEMIAVAMGGHALEGETTRFWFNRAIAAQCDYPVAYDKMRWALRPRWGGSALEMVAFGLACARAEGPESEISDQLSLALQDLATEIGEWRPLFAEKMLATALLDARKKRVARAKTPYDKTLQNGQLALEAWLCGDFALASAALEKAGDSRKPGFGLPPQVHAALRRLRLDAADFISDCRLRGGPFKDAFLAITEAREAGQVEVAARKAEEMLKDPGAREDPVLAALGPLTTFEWELTKPGWVKVPLGGYAWRSNGVKAWSHSAADLRVGSPGFPARDLFHGSLGDRYEVRCEMVLAKDRQKMAIGFVIGATGINTNDSYTFSIASTDGKATAMTFGPDNLKIPKRLESAEAWLLPELEKPVTVRLRRDKNQLSVWLDDQLVLDKKSLPDELHAGQMGFGFVAAGGASEDPHVIRKLEVRKLGLDL